MTWNIIEKTVEWSLKSVEFKSEDPKLFSTQVVTITLERNPSRVVINVILPVFFLSFLNPIVFMLPRDSGERVSFSVTIFLAYAIFMTLIAEEMPKNGQPHGHVVSRHVDQFDNKCFGYGDKRNCSSYL